MSEKEWTCDRVEQYLKENWGLKVNQGILRELEQHLKTCEKHSPEALAEVRLAALLIEDRAALSVPPLLRQKVNSLKPRYLRKPRIWRAWTARLALAAIVLMLVVWGLLGREKSAIHPGLRATPEPQSFEEAFFASQTESDVPLNFWIEASYSGL